MARGGSTELASAYLSLIPSLRGASAKIENDLRNMNLTRAGGYMGDSLSTGLLGKLKTAAAVGVKAIGAMGGAVVGLAAYGGISRALKIDQATMKFENMGISVEEAMKSCNEAVTGTAYGLDAAATVASSLAASGVQIGDEMTSSLKAVAGMAAMSGRSMEDVGIIFGKVAAQGRLQGDELTQFAESGINATAALAKHLGITQTEVRDLVSQGVIDFQTFSDAMYATFGEAAQGANETFTGAMSNVQAALSRIGEKFASPALENTRKVFVALIPALNAISALMTPLVEKFTTFTDHVSMRAVAGIEAFTEALTNTGSIVSAFKWLLDAAFEGTAIGTLVGKINGFTAAVRAGTPPVALLKAYMAELGDYMGEVLAPAIEIFNSTMENAAVRAGAFAGVFATAFAVLRGPISKVAAGLAAIAPWILKVKDLFIVFGAYVAQCGGGLLGVGRVLLAVINPVTAAVAAIATLVAGFATLMTTNEGFRETVMGLVGQIGQSLMPILQVLAQTASGLASTLTLIFTNIINAILPVIGQIAVVILQVLAALAPLVTLLVSTAAPVLAAIISTVAQMVSVLVSALMPAISGLLSVVEAVMPVIVGLVEGAMALIQGIVRAVMAIIQGDWSGAWGFICSALSSAWDSICSGVEAGIGNLETWLGGLKDSVVGFFSDAGSWLLEAGGNVITGFWEGISGSLDWLGQKLAGVGAFVAEHKGPKEYDLKLLVPNGGWIMQSLVAGLEKGMPGLKSTLNDITRGISETINPDLGQFGSRRAAYATASGGSVFGSRASGQTINNYYSVGSIDYTGDAQVERAVINLFDALERRANT